MWTEGPSWLPIETAPKDGSRMELLHTYNREMFTEDQCTSEGYWDVEVETHPSRSCRAKGCFRFDGDDGAFDIQPSHWRPIKKEPNAP